MNANARPGTGLDRPMTRRGCLLGAGLWLLVMALPVCALALAMTGELVWHRGEFVEDRIWLVGAEEGLGQGSASGLAYSAARVISNQDGAGGPLCVRTRVYFWLWRGDSERVEFCECYARGPGGQFDPVGSSGCSLP